MRKTAIIIITVFNLIMSFLLISVVLWVIFTPHVLSTPSSSKNLTLNSHMPTSSNGNSHLRGAFDPVVTINVDQFPSGTVNLTCRYGGGFNISDKNNPELLRVSCKNKAPVTVLNH